MHRKSSHRYFCSTWCARASQVILEDYDVFEHTRAAVGNAIIFQSVLFQFCIDHDYYCHQLARDLYRINA